MCQPRRALPDGAARMPPLLSNLSGLDAPASALVSGAASMCDGRETRHAAPRRRAESCKARHGCRAGIKRKGHGWPNHAAGRNTPPSKVGAGAPTTGASGRATAAKEGRPDVARRRPLGGQRPTLSGAPEARSDCGALAPRRCGSLAAPLLLGATRCPIMGHYRTSPRPLSAWGFERGGLSAPRGARLDSRVRAVAWPRCGAIAGARDITSVMSRTKPPHEPRTRLQPDGDASMCAPRCGLDARAHIEAKSLNCKSLSRY
jgi:hypothetical protein